MKKDLNTKQIKWLNDVYELNRMIDTIDANPSRLSHIKPLEPSIITYIVFMLRNGYYDDNESISNDIGVINFIKDWYRKARKAYPSNAEYPNFSFTSNGRNSKLWISHHCNVPIPIVNTKATGFISPSLVMT